MVVFPLKDEYIMASISRQISIIFYINYRKKIFMKAKFNLTLFKGRKHRRKV